METDWMEGFPSNRVDVLSTQQTPNYSATTFGTAYSQGDKIALAVSFDVHTTTTSLVNFPSCNLFLITGELFAVI
jgi:hypothetical protein